jgi:hypothetical protein
MREGRYPFPHRLLRSLLLSYKESSVSGQSPEIRNLNKRKSPAEVMCGARENKKEGTREMEVGEREGRLVKVDRIAFEIRLGWKVA